MCDWGAPRSVLAVRANHTSFDVTRGVTARMRRGGEGCSKRHVNVAHFMTPECKAQREEISRQVMSPQAMIAPVLLVLS